MIQPRAWLHQPSAAEAVMQHVPLRLQYADFPIQHQLLCTTFIVI
jgi:hypothetical protein